MYNQYMYISNHQPETPKGLNDFIKLINGNYDDDSFDTINVNYILIQSLTVLLL